MALEANALLTVVMLETELGIATGTEDAKLELIINSISAQLASMLQRDIHLSTAISEDVVGYGTDKLRVSRNIVTLTSISYAGELVNSDDYEIYDADAGLIFFPSGTTWTAQRAGGVISSITLSGTERKRYTVVYDGGYKTPPQGATVTLPFDIQAAALDMARTRYYAIGRDMSIKSESILSTSVTYGNTIGSGGTLTDIPSVAQVVSKYGWGPV